MTAGHDSSAVAPWQRARSSAVDRIIISAPRRHAPELQRLPEVRLRGALHGLEPILAGRGHGRRGGLDLQLYLCCAKASGRPGFV